MARGRRARRASRGPVALLGADAHEQLLAAQPQPGLAGQEAHPDGVLARRRQLDVELLARPAAQEGVGQLQQHPGAVAGLGIGAAGAAVLHVAERLEPLSTSRVIGLAGDAHDEAEAAGACSSRGSYSGFGRTSATRREYHRADPNGSRVSRFYESFDSVGLTGCRYRALVSLIDSGWAAWLPQELAARIARAGGGPRNRRDFRAGSRRTRTICGRSAGSGSVSSVASRIDLRSERTASRRRSRSAARGPRAGCRCAAAAVADEAVELVLTLDHDDLRELDQVRGSPFDVGGRRPRSRRCRRSTVPSASDVGRNDPCPCGSGKKFKRCHG